MEKTDKVSHKIISKWICIPFSIFVIVISSSGYNLYYEYSEIISKQGYDKTSKDYVLFAVFLGYMG